MSKSSHSSRGSIIFDNGNTVARLINATNSKLSTDLVISFDPMFLTDPSKPGYGEKFLLREGFDVIVVQKRIDEWYQDVNEFDFLTILKSICSMYTNITLYGSSMGGYAALYFAPRLSARVLAISPCCYIHPDHPSHLSLAKGRIAHFRNGPMKNSPETRGLVVYDPQYKSDKEFVECTVYPRLVGLSYLRLHYSGHSSAEFLHEIGALKRVVLGTINGTDLNVTLSGRKGSSKKYLYAFARRCYAHGRLGQAAEMMRRAIDLSPNTSDFLKFAEIINAKISDSKKR